MLWGRIVVAAIGPRAAAVSSREDLLDPNSIRYDASIQIW